MSAATEIFAALSVSVLAALLGYHFGSVRFYSEQRHKVYGEELPILLRFLQDPESGKANDEFNRALARLIIYGSRNTVSKLDTAISYSVDPSRGDRIHAIQDAIRAFRRDVHPWWRIRERSLREDEPKHYYVKV